MPSGEKYRPEDVSMALTVFAMSSKVEKEVRANLAEAGLGHVNYRTLRSWVGKPGPKRDLYEQICAELDAAFTRERIEKWSDVLKISGSVVTEAMRQALVALERGEIDVKDLTKTAKDAAVAAAVATDKIELLSGRPTDRVANTGSAEDLIRELGVNGITVIVPGQPEKKPDAIDVQAKPPAELPAGG
jgi:hypothetical protein